MTPPRDEAEALAKEIEAEATAYETVWADLYVEDAVARLRDIAARLRALPRADAGEAMEALTRLCDEHMAVAITVYGYGKSTEQWVVDEQKEDSGKYLTLGTGPTLAAAISAAAAKEGR